MNIWLTSTVLLQLDPEVGETDKGLKLREVQYIVPQVTVQEVFKPQMIGFVDILWSVVRVDLFCSKL